MLRRALALSAERRRWCLQLAAAWAAAKVRVALVSRSRLLGPEPDYPRAAADREIPAVLLMDAAAFFRHWPFPASCLERSLALQSVLRRRGYSAALKIGLSRKDGRLEAHAWLEREGEVLNDEAGVARRWQASLSPEVRA